MRKVFQPAPGVSDTPRMAAPYTHKKITEVADSAPGLGAGEVQESRFAGAEFEAQDTGFAHHHFRPGARQPFGHRHEQAEEIYVVLGGSGRLKLDDDILEIEALDAIRVSPAVTRAFEAGPDGLDVLAFGRHHEADGELIQGWWSD
jgi:mannose-6-phosphate isomerase-like protein (cupin superfamily)